MQIIAETRLMGGSHRVIRHDSASTHCSMDFALFLPAGERPEACVFFLSGLTCTWENAATKAGAQAHAAQHNMALVFPDTSPRGEQVADAESYWLGQGAGYYLTASESPWTPHFAMDQYITDELPALVAEAMGFPLPPLGITGHSMGGHGALSLAMKFPHLFASVSAFAPIASTMASSWGQDALPAYLGDDPEAHRLHDCTALMASHGWSRDMLVDQGDADGFIDDHLKPHLLVAAAKAADIPLTLNMRPGYDHSYYFIASFMADHIAWHAARLKDRSA